MTTVEDYKKGACLCRSCKNVFQNNEIEHKYIERNGQLVYEAICPCCGSSDFGLIDYPVGEEKLIYSSNFPSELKIHMDQITEEILVMDRNLLKGQRAWERLYPEFKELK